MSSDSAHPGPRFSGETYSSRLERAAEYALEAGLDALLVTPGPDLRYLVGSEADSFERLTCLVVPADGSTPSVVVPKMELAALGDSAISELGLQLMEWIDGDDPYDVVTSILPTPAATAIVDAMPALHLIPLSEHLEVMPILATDVLRKLRMIKDDAEIDALRRAGSAIDRVHAEMGRWLRAGRTEADVAEDIKTAMLHEGHTAAAFIIVGSGPHGADPHHEVSDRIIEAGDIVVVDIGGPVAPGYNSDSTRTYAIGTVSPEIADRIAVLERAQRAAVDAVKPGVTAEFVDDAARSVLASAGLGENFVHRTGHGIGLSVHEEPYIVAGNDIELVAGMAFSIEPGVYFPGEWGARIEDIVVVTADGCESMNLQPHGLTVLTTDETA